MVFVYTIDPNLHCVPGVHEFTLEKKTRQKRIEEDKRFIKTVKSAKTTKILVKYAHKH